jgi:hypothetical protein
VVAGGLSHQLTSCGRSSLRSVAARLISGCHAADTDQACNAERFDLFEYHPIDEAHHA